MGSICSFSEAVIMLVSLDTPGHNTRLIIMNRHGGAILWPSELRTVLGLLKRVCLMVNIDLHYTLPRGTPEETRLEVQKRIQNVGPDGGYILASANGITAYCKPENVRAMAQALTDYGNYPLAGG